MSTARERAKNKISSYVDVLDNKGIRLLAVDFDKTLISIHSGGIWKDSTVKLVEYIRPCIRDLMEETLLRDINVCIVTYFMQPWLIREVLKQVFKREAPKIYVQANTQEFREKHNHQFLGKEAHIAAVVTEIYNHRHVIIKPNEIILFDDDKENVDTALEFGHYAVEVKDDISYDSFEKFSKLFSGTFSSYSSSSSSVKRKSKT